MDRSIRGLLSLVVVLGAVWVARPIVWPSRFERELNVAEWGLAQHDFVAAHTATEKALILEPESPSALLLAGIAAARRFDYSRAIDLLERARAAAPRMVEAHYELAECRLHLGQAWQAEQVYRRVIELNPNHLQANRRLGFLLQAEGRSWESQPFLAKLITGGDFGTSELLAVASPERLFKSDPRLEQITNGDIIIRLGEVRRAMLEGRDDEVQPILQALVARYPELAEPLARSGRILVDNGRSEFLAWNASVTAAHEKHPEIWFVRGLFLRREGRLPEATRCFLETLLREPNHLAAHHQVSQCLLALGRTDQAGLFSDRVPLLSRLDVEINRLGREQTPETAERVIRLLQGLGRHWEAAAWAWVAGRFLDPAPWSADVVREESRHLSGREQLTALESQPARLIDLDEFPLPDWSEGHSLRETNPSHPLPIGITADWRFTDQAFAAGIDFQYNDGTTWSTRMRHVIETIGGGVGVIDFDRDSWPDLYFPQGNAWRLKESGATSLDRLFRNNGAGGFIDVTELSGLREPAFSHGVAVGDYDDDGWPDLCVTNLGRNTFFHNNGDGTFTDVSVDTGTSGDEWSTSCALVDLTGDALPDLLVVNYLDREYALQHPCAYKEFEVGCTPDALPPAANRLYVNLGNGRFADASEDSGILAHTGNGLGLVVADFAGDGQMSVFVGNDTTPNFLFRRDATSVTPRFNESGIVAGVAFDGGGSAMASMGIAAGDANGDGRLDLFVTTYLHAADTLFLQLPDGSFIDGTRSAGLYQPTLSTLGFGSQFLDVDNDGWEDLVATNGHVLPPLPDGPDDESDTMRSQLFTNLGRGVFREVPAATSGEFFQKRALGRGLCELDWNRDGRCDFCVSYLHSPAALVTNETPPVNHWLAVHLVGTTRSRDAFGTIARARIGDRELVRQLAAGNGYLASNERRLWFGLGAAESVDELVIHWPGGAVQHFTDLAADREILLIEGRQAPLALPR